MAVRIEWFGFYEERNKCILLVSILNFDDLILELKNVWIIINNLGEMTKTMK